MSLINIKEALIERLKIYVFPLLSFFILIGGIAFAYILVQRELNLKTSALVPKTSIDLPLMKSVFVGSEFDVPITIKNDAQEIIGADIVLSFDKNIIQLNDIIPNSNNALNYFLPLDTNGAFDKATIIQDGNTDGKIFFSALCYLNGPCAKGLESDQTETSPLATLRFKALAIGDTTLTLAYVPEGSTTDSNLQSKTGQDVLGHVTNLSLNIASVSAIVSSPTPSSASELIVYDDALQNPFTTNADSSTLITLSRLDFKVSGSSSMELNLFAYRTPWFYAKDKNFNSSDYSYVEFDAYFIDGPKGSVPHLFVALARNPWDAPWKTVTVAGSGSSLTITPNSGWKHIKIPFSSFGIPSNTQFNGLTIHDREPWPGDDSKADLWGHVLIDNIIFTK